MGDMESNIIRLLEHTPGLTDRELTDAIRGYGASPQYVNQNCRNLESKHIICRKKREDGLIGNWLSTGVEACQFADAPGVKKKIEEITDKKIKQILEGYLYSLGWETKIAWGLTHGIDVEAWNGLNRWIIEVRGSEPLNMLPASSFVSVLGEVLQRMDDPECKYSIALPDLQEFRRLWNRMPSLSKNRIGITALFINAQGFVSELV
jgi:hypothetical protein